MSDQVEEPEADVHLEPEPEASAGHDNGPLVFIMEPALRDINAHAAEESDHEIGGILVGSVTEGERPVVLVEASIRGEKMDHSRGSVTFTHETWDRINAVKDTQYPDLKIVGWYHSHPGFGLFLSGHDLFIHRNFFTAPWQIAVVADPLAKSWGCFTWQGQELAQDRSVHTVNVQWGAEHPVTEPANGPAQPASAPSPQIILPPPAAPHRDRGLLWALGFMGLLLALLIGITAANYHDLRVLARHVEAVSRQVTSLSHDVTVVRDHVIDLSKPAPEPGSPPAAPATGPSSPAATPTPAPAPSPPTAPSPGATP